MASVLGVRKTAIIADLEFTADEVVKTRDVFNAYVTNVGPGTDPAADALLSFYNQLIAANTGKGVVGGTA